MIINIINIKIFSLNFFSKTTQCLFKNNIHMFRKFKRFLNLSVLASRVIQRVTILAFMLYVKGTGMLDCKHKKPPVRIKSNSQASNTDGQTDRLTEAEQASHVPLLITAAGYK